MPLQEGQAPGERRDDVTGGRRPGRRRLAGRRRRPAHLAAVAERGRGGGQLVDREAQQDQDLVVDAAGPVRGLIPHGLRLLPDELAGHYLKATEDLRLAPEVVQPRALPPQFEGRVPGRGDHDVVAASHPGHGVEGEAGRGAGDPVQERGDFLRVRAGIGGLERDVAVQVGAAEAVHDLHPEVVAGAGVPAGQLLGHLQRELRVQRHRGAGVEDLEDVHDVDPGLPCPAE